MYLDYFNFKIEPFNLTPDPRFFYLSQRHEKALESLYYGVTQRKGFLLLTGEVGTGKTTVTRALLNKLDNQIEVSLIVNPLLSVLDLLKAINRDFDNPCIQDHSVASIDDELEALNKYLLRINGEDKNALVIVDEAQNLSFEAIEMTRLLSNLETDRHKLLQILLVGQPELRKMLEDHRLRQMMQRIVVRQSLTKFSFDEMRNYILHRLLVASEGSMYIDFEKRALKYLHSQTKGFPRVINAVCDRSLLEAYARKTHVINKSVVKEAIRDLRG